MSNVYLIPGGDEWGIHRIEVIDLAGDPDSYRMSAVCINCKWEGQVRISRGQRASRGIAAKGYECPACDCATVEPTKLAGRDTPEHDSRTFMEKDREWRKKAAAERKRSLKI